jgi:hypothetical protein
VTSALRLTKSPISLFDGTLDRQESLAMAV